MSPVTEQTDPCVPHLTCQTFSFSPRCLANVSYPINVSVSTSCSLAVNNVGTKSVCMVEGLNLIANNFCPAFSSMYLSLSENVKNICACGTYLLGTVFLFCFSTFVHRYNKVL